MHSIRHKIQNALTVSIAVISICAIVILFVNQIIVSQNQKTIATMTMEYSLIAQTNELVQAYNNVVKSPNDKVLTNSYQSSRTKLLDTVATLKTQIVSTESQTTLIGVENTIKKVINECDNGISEVKDGNFSNISNHFSQANINNDFVFQNTQTLIQKELEYLSSIQEKNTQVYIFSTLASIAFFILTIIAMIIYASSFSKQLVTPVQKLIETTQRVTAGDMSMPISHELTSQDDEIGILAKSFSDMVNTIETKISELNISNQELTLSKNAMEESKNALEISNSELEKLNSFMTNRELKMIELKEQIAKLQNK